MENGRERKDKSLIYASEGGLPLPSTSQLPVPRANAAATPTNGLALKSLQGHEDLSAYYFLAYASHPSPEPSSYEVRREPNTGIEQ